MRRIGSLVVVLLLLLLFVSPAHAGGWWSSIDPDKSTIAPGEELTLESDFLFRTIEEAAAARDGGWYVYLVQGLDPGPLQEATSKADPWGWWELGDASSVLLGEAEIAKIDANLVFVRATFEFPDVEPGTYQVMLCDLGCENEMGTAVPTTIEAVGSVVTARLVRQVERQSLQLKETRALAAKASMRSDQAISRAERAEEESARYFQELSTLKVAFASDQDEGSAVWPAGWAVGLLLLLGAVLREAGLRLRAWTSTFLPSSRTS